MAAQQAQRSSNWISGDAVQSKMFDSAVDHMAKAEALRHSKILWGGNALIFLGAAIASSPAGQSVFQSMADGSWFDVAVSAGLGYSAVQAYAKARGQKMQTALAEVFLSKVGASIEAVGKGIEKWIERELSGQRVDTETEMRARSAVSAFTQLGKMRQRPKQQPSKGRGPGSV